MFEIAGFSRNIKDIAIKMQGEGSKRMVVKSGALALSSPAIARRLATSPSQVDYPPTDRIFALLFVINPLGLVQFAVVRFS
ncbi:hypothetical protein QA645_32285 [Bradyrhizobium sp. CIAT3101]|uniref:hypothetical protein n=1 Tax=Bradyrhizobium sp. CIAT3101 TaxID=439387 RepID=UPI0024B15948|nr:hypothetical protein [Bradyrhizobium sp. CIAT3101]WFU79176.1 hypothetical protein QA645_32285 [Bradyrhizobium sp. CIAT3101]